MSNNNSVGFNIQDAYNEFGDLSPRDQREIQKMQAGCDHSGFDENGSKTTCNRLGTHVVFAYKHDDKLHLNDPDEVANGADLIDHVEEGMPRHVLPTEDIRIYCPEHAEHAKVLLNQKVGSSKFSDDGTRQTMVEAAKMPLSNLEEHGDPEHTSFLKRNANLFKVLRQARALNSLRHSGKIKNVPPLGYASGTTNIEENDAEQATREAFGKTSIEAATGASFSDLSEAFIHQVLNPNFEQDKAPTAMDAARQALIVQPAEKKEEAAEQKRILSRLQKARTRNEYWCPKCNKSAKQSYNCFDCGSDTVHSSQVERRSPGRPLVVGEDKKVEVTSQSINKAVANIVGNSVVVPGPNNEPVRLPSTIDNVRDFLLGNGPAPERDFRLRGVHEKSLFARSHFAPTEDFEQPEGVTPSLGEKGVQYISRTAKRGNKNIDDSDTSSLGAVFSGPSKSYTGPSLDNQRSIGVSVDSSTGEYVPTMQTLMSGQNEQFDPSGTSTVGNYDYNRSVKNRERQFGLNVKHVQNVQPSTTCHECSLTGEAFPQIRTTTKDHTGKTVGVCSKGHRTPTSNIPVAWHGGRAVHVYARPTGLVDKDQRPLFDWIPTNEPAIYKDNSAVPKADVDKASPFRNRQEAFSRRPASIRGQLLGRAMNARHTGRRITDSPEFEESMQRARTERLKMYTDLGIFESQDPEKAARTNWNEED